MFGDPLHSPKGWQVEKLNDICIQITDGVHLRPKYTGSGIPFISVKDITTGRLSFNECKYISQQDHEQLVKRCKPEFMDILYTKVGATFGRPALIETQREFSLYVSVALIKPNRDMVDPVFLNEVLASQEVKRQAERSVKGAGVPDLHLVEIRSFKVPLPPIDIQKAFVSQTRKIHELQVRQQRAVESNNLLFNSLVQRAFRGEL
jgi:type I restriction enzyme S subunit